MSDNRRPPEERKRDQAPPKKERSTSSDTRVFSPISENSKPPSTSTRRPGSSGVKKSKSNNILFFVTTVFAGVLVCVFAFSLMFKNMMDKDDDVVPSVVTPIASEQTTEQTEGSFEISTASGQMLAVIHSVNSSSLRLFSPDSSETTDLSISNDTLLKDKYGNTITANDLSIGDIVDATYSDGTISSLKISSQAVVYTETTGVDVNTETSKLNIGNKNYSYNSNTIAVYNGSAFDITQLDPVDKVTVNVYQDTVYYVEVVTGHGTLRITDADQIVGGTVDLNGEIYSFANNSEFKVSAGTYTAKVSGTNIEPYNQSISINNFDTQTLSLADVMLKIGLLTVNSNVSGAELTVNGEVMSLGTPLKLDYGVYTLRVTADGYNDHEETVTINEADEKVSVSLEKSIQSATITVYTNSAGANIYVDGEYKGPSPATVTLEHGSHNFTATKEGYLPASQVKTISSDDDNVTLNMQQELLIDENPNAAPASSEDGNRGIDTGSNSSEEPKGTEGD